jgi:outer membrane protein insertion porin family
MALAVSLGVLSCPVARTLGQTTRPDVSATYQFTGRNVDEVRILGNPTVSTSLIRNVIRTQVGGKYDPQTVQEDYQRIFDLKKFQNVEAQVEPSAAGGVTVVFIVTEQNLIKAITFRGNLHTNSAALQTTTELKPGQAIDSFRISLARQAILKRYRDDNFPFSRVEFDPDALSKTGELAFTVVEGPQVWVRNIRYIGATSFTSYELGNQVKTSTWIPIFSAGKYDSDQIDLDIGAMRHFYEDHGFFDVRIGRKLIFSPDQSELQIDFLIDEGPHYVVDHVSFVGNTRLTDAQLRSVLNLKDGRFYEKETEQRDTQEIVRKYSPFGYIYIPNQTRDEDFLTVHSQRVYLREPGRIELQYTVHEGKSFRLGRIVPRGNDKSQDKLIFREFRDLAPGSVYDSGAVQDSLERLRALPFFRNVTVTPIGDDPKYRDLLVSVDEQKTASFNIGAGISSNGGLMGNLVYNQSNFDIGNPPDDWRDTFSDRSFTGAGQGLRASFSPGTIYTSADLRFSEPWLFDQPYQFIEDLYLRDALREAYTDRRIGNEITFGRRFDHYEDSVAVSLRGELARIYNIDDPRLRAPEILEGKGTHTLTAVGLSFQHDTTNPGFEIYRGETLTAGVEAFGALGGDYTFQRFGIGASKYFPLTTDMLDRHQVLAARVNAGFITGNSVFFERFYGGDIGSVRGFRYRGIGPRSGRDNDPVGGDFQLTGSLEYSFPIYQKMLRGVFFADAGDVENDVRFGVMRVAVGPGVKFTLPIFNGLPISIYFGYPLVKAHSDDSQWISFQFGGLLQ